MLPTPRSIAGEDDYWRIRSFLREVFLLNDRQELSWHVARLDYWRWHFIENCQVCPPFEQVTTLWETAGGQIAAVLHPMGFGEAWLHLHPGYRTPELEVEVIALAEERLSRTVEDGGRRLAILADRYDTQRQRILEARGYARWHRPVHRWWRDLDAPLPDLPVAPGYTIRAMGSRDEYPARSWASWRAFHPDGPDSDYEGWAWYGNIQSAPLYRRDLDIVAVAPDGEIASFCTIWYDDVTRTAMYEPVGTVPTNTKTALRVASSNQRVEKAAISPPGATATMSRSRR
jgi:hypothetical protein